MTRLAFFTFSILFSIQHISAQSIDWLETVIIEEFSAKPILLKEMDSLKQRCLVARELKYCTESERLFDSKVPDFRSQMNEFVQKSELNIEIWTTGQKLDTVNYRFLIDYDFDLMNVAKKRSLIHYLKFDFIIIDLKNNRTVGRSSCLDENDPFEGFEYLLEQLQEFQSEGTE